MNALFSDLGCKQRSQPLPPVLHRLVASTFVMRRCGTGGTALVLCFQPRSGNAAFIMDPIRTGAGILMRCLSGSTARYIIYGALPITKERYSGLLPRNGGIAGLH